MSIKTFLSRLWSRWEWTTNSDLKRIIIMNQEEQLAALHRAAGTLQKSLGEIRTKLDEQSDAIKTLTDKLNSGTVSPEVADAIASVLKISDDLDALVPDAPATPAADPNPTPTEPVFEYLDTK